MDADLLWICCAQQNLPQGGGAAADAARRELAALVLQRREARRSVLHTMLNGEAAGIGAGAEFAELASEYRVELPASVRSRRGVRQSLEFFHRDVLIEIASEDPFEHPQMETVLEVIAPAAIQLAGLRAESVLTAAVDGLLRRGAEVSLFLPGIAASDSEPFRQALERWSDAVKLVEGGSPGSS